MISSVGEGAAVSGQGSLVVRQAWVAGVRRHFPGEPMWAHVASLAGSVVFGLRTGGEPRRRRHAVGGGRVAGVGRAGMLGEGR